MHKLLFSRVQIKYVFLELNTPPGNDVPRPLDWPQIIFPFSSHAIHTLTPLWESCTLHPSEFRHTGTMFSKILIHEAPARVRDFALCWKKHSLASTGFLEHLKTTTDGALSTQCLPSPSH